MTRSFADAKASAARQGASINSSQRPLVEGGEQHEVTLDIEIDLSRFEAAMRRAAKGHHPNEGD